MMEGAFKWSVTTDFASRMLAGLPESPTGAAASMSAELSVYRQIKSSLPRWSEEGAPASDMDMAIMEAGGDGVRFTGLALV